MRSFKALWERGAATGEMRQMRAYGPGGGEGDRNGYDGYFHTQ